MLIYIVAYTRCGSPGGALVNNPPAHAGESKDASSITGSQRSPQVGHGIPLHYSCLENSMHRGA